MKRSLLLLSLLFCAAGCVCGAPGDTTADDDDDSGLPCSDPDQDGFGAGPGCRGEDCDDTDPYTHIGCGENCDVEPIAILCPCNATEPTGCWMGSVQTQGIGECQDGQRTCREGVWSGCENQVLPSDEICNHQDDDCDGTTDEGVTEPDGTCANQGDDTGVGPDHGVEFCDDVGECDGVMETPEGWLTLGGTSISLTHIWIANSSENTVSKLDTRTGDEVGRFYTGIDASNSDPSRTAVNFDGSVFVANRAWYPPGGGADRQASVTKIAAVDDDCIDMDDNGTIDTSHDSTPLPWGQDECELWTTEVGGLGCAARAIAVGIEEGLDGVRDVRVYVGCFYEKHVYLLDGTDGEIVDDFAIPGAATYGFAITGDNIMFVAGLRASYPGGTDEDAVVDLNEWPPAIDYTTPPACGTPDLFGYEQIDSYGIAADDQGRMWTCNTTGCVNRYDPETDRWESAETPNCRGVAVDGEGYVWTAMDSGVDKFDPDTMNRLANITTTGMGGLGVAIDFDGDVWVVNEYSNDASKIDADDEREIGRYPVGTGPYTYSDMTGFQLRNITAPSGRYLRVMEVCPEQATNWVSITLDYECPPGTSIGVRARSANTPEDLAAAPWTDFGAVGTGGIAGDEIDIDDLATARYIELELELRRSDEAAGAPILKGFSIAGECEDFVG
jgi:hypothetical protein